MVDEFTHACPAIRVARKFKATDVIDALSDLFTPRGVPSHIRSDNGLEFVGPEFVAQAVRDGITAVGSKTAYLEPGSPGIDRSEELCREPQRPAPERTPERPSLLRPERGGDRHRKPAPAPQHRPAARLAGLQTARPEGRHPKYRRLAGRATTTRSAGQARRGTTASAAPTVNTDHPSEATHVSQHRRAQHGRSQQLLHSRVLFLKPLQLARLAYLQLADLGLPPLGRCAADPIPAADLCCPHVRFMLSQDRDHLALGEPALPRHPFLRRKGLYSSLEGKQEPRSPS